MIPPPRQESTEAPALTYVVTLGCVVVHVVVSVAGGFVVKCCLVPTNQKKKRPPRVLPETAPKVDFFKREKLQDIVQQLRSKTKNQNIQKKRNPVPSRSHSALQTSYLYFFRFGPMFDCLVLVHVHRRGAEVMGRI